MRLQEIIGIIRDNFYLAIVGVVALVAIFCIAYYVVYKKALGGKKKLGKRQFLVGGLIAGYIIMVIGVTFLNRGFGSRGNMNLYFLSSYREAWNSFSTRHWQFVILNIVMFVPLGILLPLLNSRFHKAGWTIGAGLLFTLTIESLQLVFGLGNFVLDDIFNNTLGAIIGYGIIMGVLILIKEPKKSFYKVIMYFSPLLIVVIIFTGIFTYYNIQEFGNLSIAPSHKINMKNIEVNLDVELSNERKTYPVYKAPTYTRASAREFVIDFFENISVDTKDMEIIEYSDEGIYWIRDARSYNVWFRYLDGSYSFSDFSSFDEDMESVDADVDVLIEKLKQFGITIPEDAKFSKKDVGSYEWKVDKKVVGNQLIDGILSCIYYNDDTIKNIHNNLVVYNMVRDVQIKTEMEAYQELLNGRFRYPYVDDIENIRIYDIELDYQLDSKGFYQPVYLFIGSLNGMEYTIVIPALL